MIPTYLKKDSRNQIQNYRLGALQGIAAKSCFLQSLKVLTPISLEMARENHRFCANTS